MAIGSRVPLESLARAAKERPPRGSKADPEKKYPKRQFVGLEPVKNKSEDTPWEMAENLVFPFGEFSGKSKQTILQGYARFESMFMSNPYLAACVKIVSGCVMAGGWRITPKKRGGKIHPQNEAMAHEFFENVHPDFSFNELLRGDMEACTLSGRLYQEIGKNAMGQPAALYSLPQASIWQVPDPKTGLLPEPPKTAYKQYVKDEDRPREVSKDYILWLRQDGMRRNSLNPISPAELIAVAHTNIDHSQRYFKSFFTSGGKMGIVIKNPKWDKAAAMEARRYYEQMFSDTDKGHQMLIVYDGSEFSEPPKQYSNWAQLIDVQKLDARKVCGIFGVDPRLVGFATEGNSLGGEGERERAMQELYTTRVNPIKELLGEQITKQILVNGLGITDAKFEFVLFQDKMDVNGKKMLADALETMERIGAINPGYLPDLNHMRAEFDENLDQLTDKQVEELRWPPPADRANAKVQELQAFAEGAKAGVVGADKLEDANLIRSVISKDLEPLDQGGLEEFRKKALISQGMATAPSMFAPIIGQLTGLDFQAPTDPTAPSFPATPPKSSGKPAIEHAEENDQDDQVTDRSISPVEEYADKWTEKASVALNDAVTAAAKKTADKLVAAYESGSTVKERLSALKRIPKTLVGGGGPMADFRRELKAYYKASLKLANKEVSKEEKAQRADDSILDEATTGEIDDYIELFGESEFDELYNTLVTRQRSIFLEAIRTGWNSKTLAKQIAAVTDDYTEREIKTIVRTAATDFFNQARIAAANEADAVTHFVFRAVGDKRTSEICRTLNGIKIGKHRTEILNQVSPACHPNCRSSLSPGFGEYETDEERLARGIKLIPAGYGGTT